PSDRAPISRSRAHRSWKSASNSKSDPTSATGNRLLLSAKTGHLAAIDKCPLSGVKRTLSGQPEMSALDPKPTFSPPEQLLLLRLAYGRGTHATSHVAGREVPNHLAVIGASQLRDSFHRLRGTAFGFGWAVTSFISCAAQRSKASRPSSNV